MATWQAFITAPSGFSVFCTGDEDGEVIEAATGGDEDEVVHYFATR